MAFIRQYGMAGDPGPRPAAKRKSAGAGPKAKANRKRQVRAQRAKRAGQGAPKGPGKKGKKSSFDLGALVKKYGPGALDLAQQFVPGGGVASKLGLNVSSLIPGSAMDQAVAGLPAAVHARMLGKHGRRTRNPANVKALRRALGRVEGFGRLVKRVNKMLPAGHRFQVHPVLKHKRKRRVA